MACPAVISATMNIKNHFSYYLLLLLFPLSFVLHGINENFGLIDASVAARLLLIYAGITSGIALISYLILRCRTRAFFFSFLFLVVYFLFAVLKDTVPDTAFFHGLTRYAVLLPLLIIAFSLLFFPEKRKVRVDKPVKIMLVFLLINVTAEAGWLLYNLLSKANQKQDFGDHHHLQIEGYRPGKSVKRPDIFWFVFDEYAASSTLKKVWNFTNPLDSVLRVRKFLIADSATSNYNFTHYSLVSTLDMVYLNGFSRHSVVTLKDLARGSYSIYDNNVLQVLRKTGYAVHNYTIFQFKDYTSRGIFSFKDVPGSLINFQTLGGRINQDIGWNFPTLFSFDKRKADSLVEIRNLRDLDTEYDALIERSIQGMRQAALKQGPSAFLFHFMLPHEPFMYNADGTVAYKNGFSTASENYIEQVKYTNTVITRLVDTLLAKYRQRDILIVLQGDHGYKFREADPLYYKESCTILYAVYCSDKDYSAWYNTMSSVNGFRIIFNKYFKTRFPMLRDTSYTLFYR